MPAFLLTLYSAREQRQLATQAALAGTEAIIGPVTVQYERMLSDAHQFLAVLARVSSVQEVNTDRLNPWFQRLCRERPAYANLGLIARDGRLLASALPFESGLNLGDRAYFQRVIRTRAFAVGDYQVGRVTGKPTLNVAYPVIDDAGTLKTVLYAALDLQWLRQRAIQAQLPPGATLLLLDQAGTILVRYPGDEGLVGRTVANNEVVQAILRTHQGTRWVRGMDGGERLVTFAPLQASGAPVAYLAVGIPRSTIYARPTQIFRRELALLGLTALATLILAWYVSDYLILRQVQALVKATRQLGSGDLAARTGLAYSHDELGRLSGSFDAMADQIERVTGLNQLILRSAGEGIWGLDLRGRTIFANPASVQMLGYSSAEELIGCHFHEIVQCNAGGAERTWETCPVYAAIRDGAVHSEFDTVFRRADGSTFPADYVATPALERGRVVGAVVTFRDISVRKQAEQEMEAARKARLAAEVEKKQFASEVIRAVTNGKFLLVEQNEIPTFGCLVLRVSLENPENYAYIRQELTELALEAGLDNDAATDLVLAMGEAATNAIKHAVQGECLIYRTDTSIVVRVSDRGSGIRAEDLPATILEAGFSTKVSLGMGYTLMLRLVDMMWLATGPSGTCVQLLKCLEPQSEEEVALTALLNRF